MTRDKVEIKVIETSPDTISHDLGLKFNNDLQSLVKRSLALMVEEIGPTGSVSIIFSGLAHTGIILESAIQTKPGTFLSFVETVMDVRDKLESDQE